MANGRLNKCIGRNKQPYLSCPHCGKLALKLNHRAGLFRPSRLTCKHCHNKYRIPTWCNFLQIGGLTLYILIAVNLNLFYVVGKTVLSYTINALIGVAISNIIGAGLAFVAPLQKDEE